MEKKSDPKSRQLREKNRRKLVKFGGQSKEILLRHLLRLGYANIVRVVNFQNHLTEVT